MFPEAFKKSEKERDDQYEEPPEESSNRLSPTFGNFQFQNRTNTPIFFVEKVGNLYVTKSPVIFQLKDYLSPRLPQSRKHAQTIELSGFKW